MCVLSGCVLPNDNYSRTGSWFDLPHPHDMLTGTLRNTEKSTRFKFLLLCVLQVIRFDPCL